MIRRLLLALALALVGFASPVVAASPVKVTADNFTVDQKNATATFKGNVVITREDLTVWADEVTVVYGAGGVETVESLTASGRVRLKTSNEEATGALATFNPNTQVLTLSGNVTVKNAQGTLNGPQLVLDLARQTTVFSSSGGGRVTGVFTPQ